jgi:Undecaprenyl-phosphate glucose phosphotransferase
MGRAAPADVLDAWREEPIFESFQDMSKNIPFSTSIVTGVVRLCDLLAILLAGLASFYLYLNQAPGQSLGRCGAAIAIAMLLAVNLFQALDLYVFERFRELRDQVGRVTFAWMISFGALLMLAFLSKTSLQYSRVWAGLWFGSALACLLFIRLVLRFTMQRWAEEGRLARRAVIVGSGPLAQQLVEHLHARHDKSVRILGIFDDRNQPLGPEFHPYVRLGNTDELIEYARSHPLDQIIIALPPIEEERVLKIVHKCKQLPLDVRLCSDPIAFQFPYRKYAHVGGVPMLNLLDRPLSGWNRVVKEIEDRLLAVLILGLAAPLIALIALLIKLDSPGPVFFRQRRYGFNKKLIEVYKFRTMYADRTDFAAERLTERNDARVTRIGSLLRRASLDELPQLLNVLKGEMSIVGPRPHAIAAKAADRLYEDAVEEYAIRHKVKPGITGWAQIKGWRGATDTLEKIQKRVEHDLYYIENWSLQLDLWIIMQTPFVGLFNKNAY